VVAANWFRIDFNSLGFLNAAVDGLRQQGRLRLLAGALVAQAWAAVDQARELLAVSAAEEASRDALVALGFLRKEGEENRYTNTPETDQLLDRSKASYAGGMLEMANRRLYRYWGNLTEGLRTGQPPERNQGR
jgi:hypothetical protein